MYLYLWCALNRIRLYCHMYMYMYIYASSVYTCTCTVHIHVHVHVYVSSVHTYMYMYMYMYLLYTHTCTCTSQNEIVDRRSNVKFTVAISALERVDRTITGNQTLTDLRDIPILNVMPAAEIEVEVGDEGGGMEGGKDEGGRRGREGEGGKEEGGRREEGGRGREGDSRAKRQEKESGVNMERRGGRVERERVCDFFHSFLFPAASSCWLWP